MIAFAKKHKTLGLLLACYAAGLALLLLWHAGGFVYGKVLRANGTLPTVELTAGDLQPVEYNLYPLGDGRYAITGSDPQFMVEATLRADSVLMELEYDAQPGLVSVYWAKTPEADHSARRLAYASETAPGVWYAQLPPGGGVHLRIDPDIDTNVVTVRRVVLNPQRPVFSYFVPTAAEWLCLAVLPLLATCALQALFALKNRKGGGSA